MNSVHAGGYPGHRPAPCRTSQRTFPSSGVGSGGEGIGRGGGGGGGGGDEGGGVAAGTAVTAPAATAVTRALSKFFDFACCAVAHAAVAVVAAVTLS